MRVTDLSKHNTVRNNLNTNSAELQKLTIGTSNGKRVNKPSDDPVGAATIQDYRTTINRSDNLKKNIGADKVWLNSTEQAIAQISDTLQHVKELAMDGANGSASRESRLSISNEIDIITNNLINLGNKKENRLYLFSGTKTFTKPLEVQSQSKPADISFNGSRIKSSQKVIPLHQDKPLQGIKPGTFSIEIFKKNELNDENRNEEVVPTVLTITLDGTESIKGIVTKINDAAIKAANYVESVHSPIGFDTELAVTFGVDDAVYIDPKIELVTKFGEDTTGFLELMKFGVVGGGDPIDPTLPFLSSVAIEPEEYKASFDGYSKDKLIFRIIKSGTFGDAQYIVSDDEGTTWSKAQYLQRNNEVFNPEGKPSNKVDLLFEQGGKPFFREGVELNFKGNEFVTYNGNDQVKEVLIDNGIKVALNTIASQIFYKQDNDPNSVNTFDVLNRIKAALEDNDPVAVTKSIGDIDAAIFQVLDKRGDIGAVIRELEKSEERIEEEVDFKSEELSKLEDLDLASASIDLNNAELKHKASLDSTARLIQPTLMNFLK